MADLIRWHGPQAGGHFSGHVAEGLLREFAASLGAVFPQPEPAKPATPPSGESAALWAEHDRLQREIARLRCRLDEVCDLILAEMAEPEAGQ